MVPGNSYLVTVTSCEEPLEISVQVGTYYLVLVPVIVVLIIWFGWENY